MRRLRLIGAALGLVFLLVRFAGAEEPKPEPKIRDFDIKTIERLGRELYERDNLASVGTDLMIEQDPEAGRRPLKGWISVLGEEGSVLYFIQEREGRLSLACTVTFPRDGKPTLKDQTGEALPEAVRLRYRARETAKAVLPKMHTPRTNLEVIDDPDGSGFIVYVLSSTTDPNEMVLGGHYRITVSADGRTAESVDALAKSLMVMPIRSPDVPKGSDTVAAVVTHIVSDTPVETHVFVSLLYRKPFYVATMDKAVWKVAEGKIEQVEKPKK